MTLCDCGSRLHLSLPDGSCPLPVGGQVDEEYAKAGRAERFRAAGTPRNAACPCGSGRKFKRCCGGG